VGVFVGVFLGLSEKKKKEVKSRGTKASSSPASRVQGKKKTHSAIQNDIVWGFSLLFFFFLKRHRFTQNMSFHLKENGAKNMSKSKSILNL
jgi:hypothetical protein